MMRRPVFVRYAFVVAATLAAVGLRAQSGTRADAEFLRKAYETYQAMTAASPYRQVPWQYLGPEEHQRTRHRHRRRRSPGRPPDLRRLRHQRPLEDG